MGEAVLFNNDIINKYSKKIFGFALSKTQDTFKAEDLSQEIIISIMNAFKEQREINDMDGFIYTICYYTWSRYVKVNIKHWRTNCIDENFDMKSLENIESDYINKRVFISSDVKYPIFLRLIELLLSSIIMRISPPRT